MVVHLNRTNHVILYVSPSCSRMMFYSVVRETKSKTPVLDKSFFISLRIYMKMTVATCAKEKKKKQKDTERESSFQDTKEQE